MLSASYLLSLGPVTLSSPFCWRLWSSLPATGTWVMLIDQRTVVNSLWGVAVPILTNCKKTLSKMISAAHISILTGNQWLLRCCFNTELPSEVLKPVVLTLHELFCHKGLLMWMLEGHPHQKIPVLLILDMNFRPCLGNADRPPCYVAVRDIKKKPKEHLSSLWCTSLSLFLACSVFNQNNFFPPLEVV